MFDRKAELTYFATRFRRQKRAILEFVEFYNRDFSLYDNHVYEHIGSRITHWWNYRRKNWFSRRIDLALKLLAEQVSPPTRRVLFIDIGFSVPYLYTAPRLTSNKNISCLLVDKEGSAKQFFDAIRTFYSIHRRDNDCALVADIEHERDCGRIISQVVSSNDANKFDSILLCASEVIEHLHEQDTFWRLVARIRDASKAPFKLYVTLPVGKRIPSHTIEFLTAVDALTYLESKMRVQRHWILKPTAKDSWESPYLQACVCVVGELSGGR